MIGEVIGQGAYAVVKKGLYIPESLTIAIKIYDKSKLEEPQRRKSVKREIKLMEMMDNEYIVKLYGVIQTKHQLYILMEYVSGLSLHGYLKMFKHRRLPEDEARRIFQQLMLGLQY
jgi:MAP/microtubule affinity-regulating kinase